MDFLNSNFLLFYVLVFLVCVRSTAYLMLIWFDGARVFVEYASLFGLRRLLPHLDKFLVSTEKGSTLSYLEFLQIAKPNSFLSKLVTCEKCMVFWLSWVSILFCFAITRVVNWNNLLLSLFLAFGISYSAYNKYKNIKNG